MVSCKRIQKGQLALTKACEKIKYEDKTFKEACQLVSLEGEKLQKSSIVVMQKQHIFLKQTPKNMFPLFRRKDILNRLIHYLKAQVSPMTSELDRNLLE